MEILHPHCAGLDVHKDSVVACVRAFRVFRNRTDKAIVFWVNA
jgi:hypothetical protein